MSAGVKLNVWFWRCRDVLTCTFVLVADLCKLFLMSINIIPSASNSKCDCTISKKWISVGWSSTCTHSPCRAISDRGFHVHSSDVDVAFAPKAFWPSMLQFLIPTNSDIAMQRDLWGPVNTGCVVSGQWRTTQKHSSLLSLRWGTQHQPLCGQPFIAYNEYEFHLQCDSCISCQNLTFWRYGADFKANQLSLSGKLMKINIVCLWHFQHEHMNLCMLARVHWHCECAYYSS